MTRLIDVTGTLAEGMWSYRPSIPDVPEFRHWRWATVDERGWEADAFAMATLTGTYLETAKHYYPNRPSIDEVPPARLVVDAAVIHLSKGAREHITVADLASAAPVLHPGDALLVGTGWDRHWCEPGETFVMESPHFERAAMEWVVAHRVGILGGDFPCFDDPQQGQGQGMNVPLLQSDALILAPLVGLDRITRPRVRLTALPLKLKGACGAPCRALVMEE